MIIENGWHHRVAVVYTTGISENRRRREVSQTTALGVTLLKQDAKKTFTTVVERYTKHLGILPPVKIFAIQAGIPKRMSLPTEVFIPILITERKLVVVEAIGTKPQRLSQFSRSWSFLAQQIYHFTLLNVVTRVFKLAQKPHVHERGLRVTIGAAMITSTFVSLLPPRVSFLTLFITDHYRQALVDRYHPKPTRIETRNILQDLLMIMYAAECRGETSVSTATQATLLVSNLHSVEQKSDTSPYSTPK